MKKSIGILFIMVAFVATAQQGKMNAAKNEYKVLAAKTIQIKDNGANGIYAEIVEGDKSVFQYRYQSAEDPSMSDDELVEFYTFQVKPDKTGKFELTGNALTNSMPYYSRSCFCADRGYHKITGGKITGVKMTKTTWLIRAELQVQITTEGNERAFTKKIKATYQMVN